MDTTQATESELTPLIMRWIGGWAEVRDYPYDHAGADTVTVSVGEPGREKEHIALTDTAAHHAALIQRFPCRPGRRVAMPTHDRATTEQVVEEAGYAVRPPEWLMTMPLSEHPRMAPPSGYDVVLSSRDAMIVAEVTTAEGTAAKGQIGVAGTDAVADRIFTMPAHRRRGLGRVVMGALAAAASEDRGAQTGLLVASVDGHGLYTALGWRAVVQIVTAGHPDDLRQN